MFGAALVLVVALVVTRLIAPTYWDAMDSSPLQGAILLAD